MCQFLHPLHRVLRCGAHRLKCANNIPCKHRRLRLTSCFLHVSSHKHIRRRFKYHHSHRPWLRSGNSRTRNRRHHLRMVSSSFLCDGLLYNQWEDPAALYHASLWVRDGCPRVHRHLCVLADDIDVEVLSEASPSTTLFTTITVLNDPKPRSTPDSGEKRITQDGVPDADIEPCEEIEICPQGNLVLAVGEQSPRKRFRKITVQSETMKNFGRRWTEAIELSEREGLLSRRRVLYLPLDDPDMMLVLMWLSHVWHIRKVPKLLSFKQLLAMTDLCEKYEMNSQVAPYIQAWIEPYQGKLLSPGREQWLTIATQFGMERHYATLARHLVLNCRVNVQGKLLIPGRRELLTGRIPQEAYSTYTR